MCSHDCMHYRHWSIIVSLPVSCTSWCKTGGVAGMRPADTNSIVHIQNREEEVHENTKTSQSSGPPPPGGRCSAPLRLCSLLDKCTLQRVSLECSCTPAMCHCGGGCREMGGRKHINPSRNVHLCMQAVYMTSYSIAYNVTHTIIH